MPEEEEEIVEETEEAEEEECPPKGLPGWMGTYADMVTLLFAFFVLLFAMSSVNEVKFIQLAQSLASAMGQENVPEAGTREGLSMADIEVEPEVNAVDELGAMVEQEMSDIASEVEELVMFNELQGMVDVSQGSDGVVITISDVVTFPSGEADMTFEGKAIMAAVSDILKQFVYHIKVEGHTDNRPINRGGITSNWELSGLRALEIVHFLIENGIDPAMLSAEAYSEFKPIASNDTPEGRSKNRRIEIVYERKTIEQIMLDDRPDTLIYSDN